MTTTTHTLLIADDDKFVRDDLADLLREPKHTLLFAATAKETLQQVETHVPDLVLLDIKFPDCQDLSLLKRIKTAAPDTEVIIISSQVDNVPQVVEAIKLGAFDFVPKPFVSEELRNRIAKALSLQQYRRSQQYLIKELQARDGVDGLIGSSDTMRQLRDTLQKLADTEACVLLTGESGTGKELAARALHYLGRRRGEPFVAVNCAAISEALVESTLFGHKRGAFTGAVEHAKGRFEAAGTGTIFLDEIGDMPLPQQAALLRVLEYRRFTPVGEHIERECRARFVLATNRDLREQIRDGKFREDLFYRINVAAVALPPLRARLSDIPELVDYFCRKLSAEMSRTPPTVHPDALKLLMAYEWPGNVRELRNMLEAAIMLGDREQTEISVGDLPPEILALRSSGGKMLERERGERQELVAALKQANGNLTQAARLLGCHRNTIRARIRYYGIVGIES